MLKISSKEMRKIRDSNSLWRIVLPSALEDGGKEIHWNDHFRLQHCATGLYLSVIKEKSTGLEYLRPQMTPEIGPETLFQFHPFKQVSNLE